MIERGAPWGEPVTGDPDLVVEGGDAALAAALASTSEGSLVGFRPGEGSDFALSVGIRRSGTPSGDAGRHALPVDLLRVDGGVVAVNAVVFGPAPARLRAWHRRRRVRIDVDGTPHQARATTVVVASGQFVEGLDTVPRGHPGDGILEVQVYDVPRAQVPELRRRLRTGSHVPHPGIRQFRGTRVTVSWDRPVRVSADGLSVARAATVSVEVVRAPGRLVF